MSVFCRDLDGSNNAAEGLRILREEQFSTLHGDRPGVPNAGMYYFVIINVQMYKTDCRPAYKKSGVVLTWVFSPRSDCVGVWRTPNEPSIQCS